MGFDFGRKAPKRQDAVDPTGSDGLARHAVDDAAGFILGEGSRTGRMHFDHAGGAIVPHRRQNDAERISPGGLCRGPEKHVNRRAMAADIRPVHNADPVLAAVTPQEHVMVPRRDEDQSGVQGIAIDGLTHLDLAEAVQPLGEGTREMFRHVLDDDNRRRRLRQGCQDRL